MRASSRPTSRIGSPIVRPKPLAGAGLGILQPPVDKDKQKEEAKPEKNGLWTTLTEAAVGGQQQDPVARLKLLLVSALSGYIARVLIFCPSDCIRRYPARLEPLHDPYSCRCSRSYQCRTSCTTRVRRTPQGFDHIGRRKESQHRGRERQVQSRCFPQGSS